MGASTSLHALEKRSNSDPAENKTTVPWMSSLKPNHYTDCTIPYS